MKKHHIYIETRGFIMLCVNTVITFALLVCALLEHIGAHINVSVFAIFAVAGIADIALSCLWVFMPYLASKKALALFASGYSFEGLFDKAHPLSPEMEKAQAKLSEMLKSTATLNVSKRQAQFIALQNQINPHFLYNTLEGIRSEALGAGLSSIANITEALSLFFRYTISQMESLVSLKMELENTRDYFTIQQYRFGTRLHLNIIFDGESKDVALSCKLPKLTLQPIVENAIVHGIEGATGEGHLVIKIVLTDERLLITVSDDGAGMDKITLSRLQERLSINLLDDTPEGTVRYAASGGYSPTTGDRQGEGLSSDESETRQGRARGGIALRNVNKRIKILFGEEYGITVESNKGAGTDVRISLPRKKDGDAIPKEGGTSPSQVPNMARHEVLRLENVISAPLLNGLSFEVFEGEICALVSVDNVGLDHLISLLTMAGGGPRVAVGGGVSRCKMPDYGHIILTSGKGAGGVFVIQGGSALQLIDGMSIADNIKAVRSDCPRFLHTKAMKQETAALLEHFGLIDDFSSEAEITQVASGPPSQLAGIKADTLVRDLSAYQKTILALAKAHTLHSPLVVLNNITQFLTMDDTERVMAVVREIAADGTSFLYICNHHQEAFRYCDYLLFMRGGKITKRLDRGDINALVARGGAAASMEAYFNAPYEWAHSDEHKSIVSSSLSERSGKEGFWFSAGETAFAMQKGETALLLDNDGHTMQSLVSLLGGKQSRVIRRDCFRGSQDSRNRLLSTPLGYDGGATSGAAYVDGVPWSLANRKSTLIPAEPTKRMLFPQLSLIDNLCFTLDGKLPHFWLTPRARKAVAHDVKDIFGKAINAPYLMALDETTLYRIVYQRVLIQHPSFVCAVQPLSSCDMMTRLMILKYLDAFRERGITTLLVSYAASDLLEVSDRLLVVGKNGKITEEYTREQFSSFGGVSGLVPE